MWLTDEQLKENWQEDFKNLSMMKMCISLMRPELMREKNIFHIEEKNCKVCNKYSSATSKAISPVVIFLLLLIFSYCFEIIFKIFY